MSVPERTLIERLDSEGQFAYDFGGEFFCPTEAWQLTASDLREIADELDFRNGVSLESITPESQDA